MADLAEQAGVALKTYRNKGLHKLPGHPPPVSSSTAKVLLWDGEQVDAFRQGAPVPPLPADDSPQDLLDRNEAAELAGVSPRTWDRYENLPGVLPRPAAISVAGVEHWRRGDIEQWLRARPGPGNPAGRPKGSTEQLPRVATGVRVRELLARNPRLTAAGAARELGISAGTAQRALAQARAANVREWLERDPGLTAEAVQALLGYPLWAAERALEAARSHPEGE
ncbi:helix-turn-helix transcriptional regulator [Streptomyces sp. NPDC013953]|uniref:helix-turn-helix transcriptional regulator n=1 Tax=Streptomyces sp. NPDC013953 TaxID=3364868 RepID=UPI0036F525FD